MNYFCFLALFSAISGNGMHELRSGETVEQAVLSFCVAFHRTQDLFSDLCRVAPNPFSVMGVRCLPCRAIYKA